jgi:hypothetical protein
MAVLGSSFSSQLAIINYQFKALEAETSIESWQEGRWQA